MAARGPRRDALSCGNLAHGFAACGDTDKDRLKGAQALNIGIVTAYNDMLSAHQPYERFPELIRAAARESGVVAQVAGGVPAMCDGVTQGQVGMELSLISRDVIAMGTAVALSHDMFDGALMLGICDKIVPGLIIGALAFGHLPTVLVPAGPMPSGHLQQREDPHPPALCRGQARAEGAPGVGERLLSRAGHLYLLRHRQLEPDAHGDHGPAPARRRIRQPEHAPARRADPRRHPARGRDHRPGQRLHARWAASWTSAPSSTASSG